MISCNIILNHAQFLLFKRNNSLKWKRWFHSLPYVQLNYAQLSFQCIDTIIICQRRRIFSVFTDQQFRWHFLCELKILIVAGVQVEYLTIVHPTHGASCDGLCFDACWSWEAWRISDAFMWIFCVWIWILPEKTKKIKREDLTSTHDVIFEFIKVNVCLTTITSSFMMQPVLTSVYWLSCSVKSHKQACFYISQTRPDWFDLQDQQQCSSHLTFPWSTLLIWVNWVLTKPSSEHPLLTSLCCNTDALSTLAHLDHVILKVIHMVSLLNSTLLLFIHFPGLETKKVD